jgi:hypothetical protein
MQVEEYEHIVEAEEERLSVHLFGMNYRRLSPELQDWIRSQVITDLWTAYAAHTSVAARRPRFTHRSKAGSAVPCPYYQLHNN